MVHRWDVYWSGRRCLPAQGMTGYERRYRTLQIHSTGFWKKPSVNNTHKKLKNADNLPEVLRYK
jgi:hypothetical protein